MSIAGNPRPWRSFAALGDSFTEGLCDEVGSDGRHLGWADRVASDLAARVPHFEYANLAVRGRLAPAVRSEQVPAALGLGAELVSFGAGVNDTLRRSYDPSVTARAIEGAVRELRGAGSDVLLFAWGDPSRRSAVMGRVRERIRILNRATRAIAEAYDCYLVNFWGVAVFDENRHWDADRLHLSPSGHAMAAALALQALGLGDDRWRTPYPIDRVGRVSALGADLAWARGHFGPWLARRMAGRSSGDGISAKRPSLQQIRADATSTDAGVRVGG